MFSVLYKHLINLSLSQSWRLTRNVYLIDKVDFHSLVSSLLPSEPLRYSVVENGSQSQKSIYPTKFTSFHRLVWFISIKSASSLPLCLHAQSVIKSLTDFSTRFNCNPFNDSRNDSRETRSRKKYQATHTNQFVDISRVFRLNWERQHEQMCVIDGK